MFVLVLGLLGLEGVPELVALGLTLIDPAHKFTCKKGHSNRIHKSNNYRGVIPQEGYRLKLDPVVVAKIDKTGQSSDAHSRHRRLPESVDLGGVYHKCHQKGYVVDYHCSDDHVFVEGTAEKYGD